MNQALVKKLTKVWQKCQTSDLAIIFEGYMQSIKARKVDRRRNDNKHTYTIDGKSTGWNRVQCYYHTDSTKYCEENLLLVLGMTEAGAPAESELALVMQALSDYYRVTSERLKLSDIREQTLRNAYISGTGIVYTWWDDRISTGLYADDRRTTPIKGDISCDVLDVENVYFGDPNLDSIQEQPYIIIAQRLSVSDLRREARRCLRP